MFLTFDLLHAYYKLKVRPVVLQKLFLRFNNYDRKFICGKIINGRISTSCLLENQIVRFYNTKPKLKKQEELYIKDITLYKNDQVKFYKYLALCSISQFIFWTYLSYVAFTTMKDVPLTEHEQNILKKEEFSRELVPIWRRINIGKYKDYLAGVSIIIGFSAILLSTLYTVKSVRCIVLKKGGEYVSIEFYSVFGKGRSKTIALEDISAKHSRQNADSYIALKERSRKFHYIVDMKGNFYNGELFDKTIGLKRSFR